MNSVALFFILAVVLLVIGVPVANISDGVPFA